MMTTVSTLALRMAALSSMAASQARLASASEEVSTGRHHDVGLVLGPATGHTVELRMLAGELDAIRRTNALVDQRLATMQSALGAVSEIAQSFADATLSPSADEAARRRLVDDARGKLSALTGLLGATSNGAYVFGGENSTLHPLGDYLASPQPAARLAVQAAFSAEFGFGTNDPSVRTISASAIEQYLDGTFAALFSGPTWQASFSKASDRPLVDRIAPEETIATRVSVNDVGIRGLVAGLTAVIDSGTESLSDEAFSALTRNVFGMASKAISEITQSRAAVGLSQNRVTRTGERLEVQTARIEHEFGSLEGIDAAEAITRMNMLSTALQASYASTARLQGMSILDYL